MERYAAEVAQRPMLEEEARRKHKSRQAYFRAMARENKARHDAQRELGWNSTPHRNCPAHLRGLKPVTMEPWSRDASRDPHTNATEG